MNSKLKYIGIAVIIAALVASTRFINFQDILTSALEWINRLGPAAAIVFIAIYVVAAVLFFPASILTLGAGVVFGVVQGSIFVFIGATIGATLAFLVGRYLARGWVEKRIEGNPKFKAIDQAVAEEGMKIVLLTRLSPIFPFNLLNYAYGLTKVTLRDYVIGTLGILPGTIMYVYVGSLAKNLATLASENVETPSAVEWAIRILVLITIVGVTFYITKIARKALNQKVETETNP
ncbi:SNARE associated Golgi family protein [Halothece sp. PCC 7418]|uniref:TVP38/TMEM64 family protein n=1 Tax=Halothece sp. (strain PCC 7418) TaxID=65093 RepID=UPI0002A072F4|nr:TVP38/TMEM64 family protein [Halothece sp. PCC 7418]AFZ45546.1 SNARE associated Golgi family protein [Halothece sp. PCC 7418]